MRALVLAGQDLLHPPLSGLLRKTTAKLGSECEVCVFTLLRIAAGRCDGGKQRRPSAVVWPRWQARSSGEIWPPIGTAGPLGGQT